MTIFFWLQDDEDEEEDEEEERIRIKLTVEEDYDIGHCIRTAVVSESVLWFTGRVDWCSQQMSKYFHSTVYAW